MKTKSVGFCEHLFVAASAKIKVAPKTVYAKTAHSFVATGCPDLTIAIKTNYLSVVATAICFEARAGPPACNTPISLHTDTHTHRQTHTVTHTHTVLAPTRDSTTRVVPTCSKIWQRRRRFHFRHFDCILSGFFYFNFLFLRSHCVGADHRHRVAPNRKGVPRKNGDSPLMERLQNFRDQGRPYRRQSLVTLACQHEQQTKHLVMKITLTLYVWH